MAERSIMAAAKAKTQSPEPSKRRDPIRRSQDGVSPLARLANTDPERKYVWVNTNDALAGVDYYLSLGYEVEQKREGGPQQLGFGRNPFRRAEGMAETYIMFQGNVLMSCTIGVAEDIEEFGPDGASGQVWFDGLEKRITGKDATKRLLRDVPGIVGRDGSPVIHIENETAALAGSGD